MYLASGFTNLDLTLEPWMWIGVLTAVMTVIRFASPKFFFKYLWSHDHKMISKQFLVSSLLWAVIGGGLAMAVRYQLAWPGDEIPVVPALLGWDQGPLLPENYNVLFTMHASIMIFFVIIPILVGAFANFVVPLQIGAKDMAFPFLNALSYWLMWPAFILMICSFYQGGEGPGGGWTAYPPLSTTLLNDGQSLWLQAVWFVGWSSICGATNYLTTIIKMRAPGLTMFKLPLTVWSIFITSILVLCATPVLGSSLVMQLMDREMGTSFFLPTGRILNQITDQITGGGHVILWQHLFWFYSHPAVYIMVLPAMGIISDLISTGARKPIFGYRPMVYSMIAIAGLGFIVWGHHMFQAGMNPSVGTTFMIATMMIALPSAIKTFNWLGTIYRSQIRFTVPMLCALAFLSMWIIGGLSGIFMAATPVDIQIHDTYAIVAHIHYIVFGATLFAVFGGLYFWFPKMFGRYMNKPMGIAHFWLTFIAFQATFFPMHIVGSRGMLRRTADPFIYSNLQGMLPMNQFITISSFVLGAAQIIFAVNFFWSMYKGKKLTERNPWQATTLEWSTPTPPVDHGNFDIVPVVYRRPYEFGHPDADEDYVPQFQPPVRRPEETPKKVPAVT